MRGLIRAGVLAAALGGADGAWAHTEKMTSEPADGATVASVESAVLRFDEPVRLTAVTLSNGAGEEIALPRSRSLEPAAQVSLPLPELRPGDYRLDWRALSADGHPVSGGFDFTVAP